MAVPFSGRKAEESYSDTLTRSATPTFTPHAHAEGEGEHAHAAGSGGGRIPSHVLGSVSLGVDLLRRTSGGPRLTIRLDVENLANQVYVVAREGEFSPAQYSMPRLVSLSARVAF
jgi:hypothetical protein